MEKIHWWQWLWSLFKRKPKELSWHEESVKHLHEIARTLEPAPYPHPLILPSKLDELDQLAISLIKDKMSSIEGVRQKILTGDYFKKAFELQVHICLTNPEFKFIASHDLNLSKGIEYDIFMEEFSKILDRKVIKYEKNASYIQIDEKSFIAYVQRCEEQSQNIETITIGPYR